MVQHALPIEELKAPGHQIFAWVEVDGVKAPIYGSEVSGKVVSGWIESKVGSEWVLCYRLATGRPQSDIRAAGSVDGSYFGGLVTSPWHYSYFTFASSSSRTNTLSGTDIAVTEEKRLAFTPLFFTDDVKLACANQSIIDGLGTIKLTVHYGTISGSSSSPGDFPEGPSDQSPIASELMTSLDMTERTKHSRVAKTKKLPYCDFTPLEEENGLVCEFKFFYRSRDILEKNGIKAKSRSASSSSFTLISPSRSKPGSTYASSLSGLSLSTSRSDLDEDIKAQRRLIRREREELKKLELARSAANSPGGGPSS